MDHDSLRRLEFDKIRNRLAALAQFVGEGNGSQSGAMSDLSLSSSAWPQTDEGIIVLRFHDTGFLAGMEDIAPICTRSR